VTFRHHTMPRGKFFVSIPEPHGPPQRMECRTCKAQPGQPCSAARSGKTNLRFHLSRWRDFNVLRNIELKIELSHRGITA
jgi:hypothetical protein